MKVLLFIYFSLNIINTLASIEKKICLTPTCVLEAAKLLNTIDESISPCDDFYQFSCGKWIQNKQLPEHKSITHRFSELQDELNEKIKDLILKTNIESDSNSPDFVKNAKKYYESCVNTSRLQELGDKPLREVISKMGGFPLILQNLWNHREWTDVYLMLSKLGLTSSVFFSLSISPDFVNNTRRILSIDQGSYGIGGRDSVLKPENDSSVKAYKNLMMKSSIKLGAKPDIIDQFVKEIFDFEMLLANNSMAKEFRRNITAIYNKISIKKLHELAPKINWLRIIRNDIMETIKEDEEIVVFDIQYIKFLNEVLPKYSDRFLVNYIIWRVIESEMSGLNEEWYQLKEEFDFVVYGTKSRTPRWEMCIKNTKASLSMALSHLYIKNFFRDEDKEKASQMFTNIVKEFKMSLETNKWMADETRAEALRKIDAMKLLVGYPNQLIDESKVSRYYKTLIIDSKDYFGNNVRLAKWYTEIAVNKLKEPVNPLDWRDLSSVAVVNAYYHMLKNLVVMPAGILQGVFFNKNRPDYLNYGSIGYVAGHEIIHGFDDGGRQYDSNGNLRNWWDNKTDHLYKEKTKCIIEIYSNYSIGEIGQNLNGINTQGENIADNGGVIQSFRAYLKFVEQNGPEPTLPALNMTSEQLFWISSAVQYCSKATNEYLKLQIMTDRHSPSRQRVNGVVANSIEFAKVFNCPLGSKMNPIKKCTIW